MTSPARRPLPIARSPYRAATLVAFAAFAAFAAAGSLERTAFADSADRDEKQLCVAASEKGQQLRTAGKLVEAREQFSLCGRAECPKLIQQDCTQWTGEVLAALPSVVPAAKDRNGRDMVDVRLTVDGNVVTEILDGKPIVLDPGVHAFVFEAKAAAGAAATDVKEQVVVRPGEKNRIVTVTFASADNGGKSATDARDPRDTHDTHDTSMPSKSSPPVVAYVLGGLGIAALGVAGVMGLLANGDAHDLRSTCAPNCNQGDVDAIQTRYTISGVTAGVGGVLLVTGVVLFIVHKRDSQAVTANGSSTLLRF
jgi:hypothetical protein